MFLRYVMENETGVKMKERSRMAWQHEPVAIRISSFRGDINKPENI